MSRAPNAVVEMAISRVAIIASQFFVSPHHVVALSPAQKCNIIKRCFNTSPVVRHQSPLTTFIFHRAMTIFS